MNELADWNAAALDQVRAIQAAAIEAAASDAAGHHFTDHEENAIDRHLDACEGCRRCRRNQTC